MLKSKEQIFLDPKVVRSFAGVRGRVKAAVATQARSVTLAEALAQTRRSKGVTGTTKSNCERSGRPGG
jgi:hypothetical protein